MITPTQIYWLTRLDSFNHLTAVLIAVGIVATAMHTIYGTLNSMEGDADQKILGRKILRRAVRWMVATILLSVTLCLTPTTKEMAAIIVIPRIANSETVQQLGKGIVDLAHQWLVELAPKAKEVRDGEM